jgi:hypothetical protein
VEVGCLDEETEKVFSRLQELNCTQGGEGDVEAYTLAIDSLKAVFREMSALEKMADPHVSMT